MSISWKSSKTETTYDDDLGESKLTDMLQILLVDDSSTMRQYWPELTKVVDLISYIVKRWDKNGIDLQFTIQTNDIYNLKNATPIVNTVEGHIPSRATTTMPHMQARVDPILRKYRQSAEKQRERRWSRTSIKKTILFVFTDGLWQPESSPETSIRELVKTLHDFDMPDSQFGIQFIRFGEEAAGIQMLDYLDDLPYLHPYVDELTINNVC